ncbi:hypothetical protein QBC38DRAFT_460051 [Podospora fimiseda]|uniref:Uncharacterized protein n=1 Tax=Podospora fimiseda TaxID=252190 RepID=A0AAN7BFV6_9PEZI|nr:hypothetical protein QBC38DRAFT_460051 [Podospora fimiseda]
MQCFGHLDVQESAAHGSPTILRCSHGMPCDTTAISLMLAFGLSKAHCDFGSSTCFLEEDYDVEYNFTKARTQQEAIDLGEEIRIKTTFWIWTYGYGLRGCWLKAVELAVLRFHGLLVVIQVGLILGRGSWTSNARSSMGEIVGLALSCTPPRVLNNATAGISKMST